jgi:hypothetical protein
MIAGAGAGRAPQRPIPAQKPPALEKAWLDAKTVCIFRLGQGPMPQDSTELSSALNAGWRDAITLPDPAKAVVIEGGTYPSVDSMLINFSDGRLRPADKKTEKKSNIELNNKVEKNLQVEHLEVRGTPMLYQSAHLNMRLLADSAQIDMERDRRGRPVMMLSQAKSGSLSLDVSRADAESLMLHNAREMAAPYGINIERMQFTVLPETPRSIKASLYVATKIAFIPAGMLFQCHVTIDDSMNAKITGLTCEGDEALGPLIVHFLRPALAKVNDKSHPLVSFPAQKMHLRDVAVRVDDGLHLKAEFGT